MGLYLDVVAPASEVLWRMERRGMPLDAERRDRLRAETAARLEVLALKIRNAADDFHTRRRGKIEVGIAKIRDRAQALEQALGGCQYHPKYRGLSKPGSRLCEECRTLFLLRGKEREEVQRLRAGMRKWQGVLQRLGSSFKPTSPDHWRAWLFSVEGLGLKPLEHTKKSQKPSIDDDVIEALQKRHPEIEALRWRVDHAHLSNRISGPLSVESDPDGRVRFAYSLHRTGNGQIASGLDEYDEEKPRESEGNAQNITDVLRQIFVAPRGMKILHADYSQIEARIMAWNARARELYLAFLRGEDVHSLNAAAIYGCPASDARKFKVRFGGAQVSARYACKRATHGWDYGMMELKTARLYGLTFGEAKRARDSYFRRWPELLPYQTETVLRVNRDRFLVNWFGRKLRFHSFVYRDGVWQTADREEAIAFPVASTAKDLAKAVMPSLDEIAMSLGGEMITTTHDSFTFLFDEHAIPEAVARLRPAMERPWPQLGTWPGVADAFSCPAEFAVGQCWGEYHAHESDCPPDCDAEILDGLVKIREAA